MSNTDTSPLAAFMAPVNELLSPAIRLGMANPWPLTTGFVLLEVTGRRTGLTRSVPLLATDYGSSVVVSTVRNESQWLRNLAAIPEAAVWLRGRRRLATARVYRRGVRLGVAAADQTEDLPGQAARAFSRAAGISVAILKLCSS
jgi:deazaflavin-dependent oxidoreductase (nitroreductase family)